MQLGLAVSVQNPFAAIAEEEVQVAAQKVHFLSEGSDTESCREEGAFLPIAVVDPRVQAAEALVNNLIQGFGPVVAHGALSRGSSRDGLQ